MATLIIKEGPGRGTVYELVEETITLLETLGGEVRPKCELPVVPRVYSEPLVRTALMI